MKFLLAILALAFLASASLSKSTSALRFQEWQTKHNKVYKTQAEVKHRLAAFSRNVRFVDQFDAKARGFTVSLNQFADLTSEEFVAVYNGMNLTKAPGKFVPSKIGGDIVDWRTKGAVTPVKNQGQCGSCWAFSTTGSTEGVHFLATQRLISLSEQNLVDCSTDQGNQGCDGGLMDQAFQYIISNKGIDTEDSYPYTATGPNTCEFNPANVGALLTSFTDVASGDESALQKAVDKQPVSVAIDASQQSFQLYTSGVYNEPDCSSSQLDHGVLAVGYGSDQSSTDYWIVKNSWGTGWGMQGYILMSRNSNNQCGIATAASYPISA
jgi:cathepsin L